MSWTWSNDFRSKNIVPKEQIQKFLHKWAFTNYQIEPLSKAGSENEWNPRFKFIGLQDYCPHCKVWGNGKGGFGYCDYCSECSFDFFSHLDLKRNQLAPLRRGKCTKCRLITLDDLNGEGQCKLCFNDPNKNPKCIVCKKFSNISIVCNQCFKSTECCSEICQDANQQEHLKVCQKNQSENEKKHQQKESWLKKSKEQQEGLKFNNLSQENPKEEQKSQELHDKKQKAADEQKVQTKCEKTIPTCNTCKKQDESLLICGKCRKVRYCNQDCQVSDWKKHKLLCFK